MCVYKMLLCLYEKKKKQDLWNVCFWKYQLAEEKEPWAES